MEWQRITPFESNKTQQETWICRGPNYHKKHSVEVTLGKEIDILSLKINFLEDFDKKVSSTKISRTSTFQSEDNLEKVNACPICEHSSIDSESILNIYGACYHKCSVCSHYFLLYRPTDDYLNNFYKTNTEYQSTYADKRTLDTRIEQVVIPKVKYVLRQYKKKYGRSPKSIVDVGAGSGHFVYACRKLGISCEGVEISDSGRAFCRNNFNIDLHDINFLEKAKEFNCDIITFWGLIEHIPTPVEMLKASQIALNNEGMIVAEVPRWDCLSTAIHTILPGSVIRHLDPMDHIQCFSDTSLATAFTLSGYEIVSAWYFGMDAFELVTQISYFLNDNKVIDKMRKKLSVLQERLDMSKLSDFVIFTGILSN